MHLGMTKFHIPFLGHCDLEILPSFKKYFVRSISLIFFEVGIPNLVSDESWDGKVSHFIFGSL